MWKFACVALTSAAALSVASLPAGAQSSESAPGASASSTPLPSIPVRVARPKKVKKARPEPAIQEKREPAGTQGAGAEGGSGQGQNNPPSIRNTSADTGATKSYSGNAVTIGGKEPLSRREVPQTVSVITRQQMNDQNIHTAMEALIVAPGVTFVSNGPDQGQYFSRGAALNVAYDGVPVYNSLSGYQQFDTAMYDRIEVLRGPAGLFVGSGDPSGVVNYVHKRPGYEPAVGWSTSYGSWNNKYGELDLSTPLNESKTLRFRGVLAGGDKEFFWDRDNESRGLGYGILEYDLTPSTLITASVANQFYTGPVYSGLPAYADGHFMDVPRSTNIYPDWGFMKWNTTEYMASAEQKLSGDWRAKVTARLQEQGQSFNQIFPMYGVDPAAMTADYRGFGGDWNYERTSLDAYITGPFHLFGQKHNLLLGYNYDEFDTTYAKSGNYYVKGVSIFNPNASLPPFEMTRVTGGETLTAQSGFYGQARIKLLNPLTVVAGGRVSDYWSKSRDLPPSKPTPWLDGSKADSQITPYGAVLLDLTKNLTLYGSYSDIFIPQSQLKWSGGMLDPRIGAQYEVGLKGEYFNKKVQTSLALFEIDDTNRSFNDPDHPGFYLQLGQAVSKGVDAEITGRVYDGLDLVAAYTYLDTELVKAARGQGGPISYWYPKHTIKAWAKYQFQTEELKRWSVGLGMVAMGDARSNSTDPGARYRTQPFYAVFNAQVGYQIEKDLSLTLSVNNIFDKHYYTRLGGLNTYNTPGEPRNFMLTLRKSMN